MASISEIPAETRPLRLLDLAALIVVKKFLLQTFFSFENYNTVSFASVIQDDCGESLSFHHVQDNYNPLSAVCSAVLFQAARDRPYFRAVRFSVESILLISIPSLFIKELVFGFREPCQLLHREFSLSVTSSWIWVLWSPRYTILSSHPPTFFACIQHHSPTPTS